MPKNGYKQTEEHKKKNTGNKNGFKIGHKINSGKKRPWQEGEDEKSFAWKGDGVGYRGLHIWVGKHLGKPNKCSLCGLDEIPKGMKRYFQWANISRKYTRDLSDWIRLCVLCHKRYDYNK